MENSPDRLIPVERYPGPRFPFRGEGTPRFLVWGFSSFIGKQKIPREAKLELDLPDVGEVKLH